MISSTGIDGSIFLKFNLTVFVWMGSMLIHLGKLVEYTTGNLNN